jgi:peptide deformylase
VRVKANGWLARIFQHENDHLNGVLFIDIADSVWQPVEENSLEK